MEAFRKKTVELSDLIRVRAFNAVLMTVIYLANYVKFIVSWQFQSHIYAYFKIHNHLFCFRYVVLFDYFSAENVALATAINYRFW